MAVLHTLPSQTHDISTLLVCDFYNLILYDPINDGFHSTYFELQEIWAGVSTTVGDSLPVRSHHLANK
jgi:hypothetical protein